MWAELLPDAPLSATALLQRSRRGTGPPYTVVHHKEALKGRPPAQTMYSPVAVREWCLAQQPAAVRAALEPPEGGKCQWPPGPGIHTVMIALLGRYCRAKRCAGGGWCYDNGDEVESVDVIYWEPWGVYWPEFGGSDVLAKGIDALDWACKALGGDACLHHEGGVALHGHLCNLRDSLQGLCHGCRSVAGQRRDGADGPSGRRAEGGCRTTDFAIRQREDGYLELLREWFDGCDGDKWILAPDDLEWLHAVVDNFRGGRPLVSWAELLGDAANMGGAP